MTLHNTFTSVPSTSRTRPCTEDSRHLLTKELEERQGGHSKADREADDDETFLVSNPVVEAPPHHPAHPVTNVGEDPDVGVECVGGYEKEAV